MYCVNCGNQIPTDSRFCDKCGAAIDISSSINSASQPTSNKKVSKAVIILSILLAASLVACTVLGFIVSDQAGTIAYKEKTLDGCYEVIDDKERENKKLTEEIGFYNRYVVFGLNNSEKQYHKYDCVYFQNLLLSATEIWVGLAVNLRDDGFHPCQNCCK